MASGSNSTKYEIIDLDSYIASSSNSNKYNIIDLDSQQRKKRISPKNMASSSNSNKYDIIDLDSYPDINDLDKTFSPSQSPMKRKRQTVKSEPSKLPEPFCGICMDTKARPEMFSNTKVCNHQYCSDCISSHVAVKIQENIVNVKCPDPNCKGLIGPEVCRDIVPKEVLERWEAALCESLILGSQKFYCPFKDCSAMLVDDGGMSVTSSRCPNCNRLFCAQCKVAWHSEMDCSEFKKLKKNERNPEDIILMKLAKDKKWRRCPSCNIFVEKIYGCNYIRCRCGYSFCYTCGTKGNTSHFCTNCQKY